MRWFMQRPAWLVVGLLALQSFAKKDKPAIEVTAFKGKVVNLMYFEDSDVLLFTDRETGKIWHSDDAGFSWSTIKEVEEVVAVIKHPYDSNVAVLLGAEKTHWITKDQAKTWRKFSTPTPPKFDGGRTLSFHASDPDRIIVQGADCADIFACKFPIYYTLDGFKTNPEELLDDAISCLWAKTTKEFTTGDEDLDKSRVICNVEGAFSFFSSDSKMLISDDFFKSKGTEPLLDGDRPVSGIINVAPVTRYLAAAASSDRSNELALYVSTDCTHWQRAEFGKHKIEEDAYTILESTNYSLQVDVQTGRSGSLGALYTSNTEGTFFTTSIEHTNRDPLYGFVDFEKIQNIPGIVLVNKVKNWKEVDSSPRTEKEIVTEISFDDGRNWTSLLVGKKQLHLHSVTDQVNIGRVFSSPAPGIIMGVGNTGDVLTDRSKGDTYISDDAGLTWSIARKGPHLYEMGDQGALLVMISDDTTNEIMWSINHGKDWSTAELPHKVKPLALTTTPDSTSLKFILLAESPKKDKDGSHLIIALDFAELHEKKCEKGDFEEWYARVDEDGKPTCLMGHTHMFRRRKADADCFVDEEFKDPEPLLKDCDCTDADYECDFGFVANDKGECEPDGPLDAPSGECDGDKDTFIGSSGYRLIPGNTCTRRGGVVKDEPVERKCHETTTVPPSGAINATMHIFREDRAVREFYYLERCEKCKGDDETIVARTDRNVTWITQNHGKDWSQLFSSKDKITAIYPHQYFDDQVFFITEKKKVYYSKNRGATIHSFDVPEPPNQDSIPALSFHPKETEWLIWVGERNGQTIAQVSKKHGDDWETLLRSVGKCDFMYREIRPNTTNLIYCEQHDDEDPEAPLSLVGSNDWFVKDRVKLKEDVVNFATMAEFIVVARNVRDDKSLRVDASIDGKVFADAVFPRNFQVEHQSGYTVLDSNTHSIFMHVTVSSERGREYGAIVKSNSNGTAYTLAVSDVNRNRLGFVDFEKVQGLEGVSLVNVVANVDEISKGDDKKLKTLITHNDGAEWATIARPKDAGEFKRDWCSGPADDCSLHLIGYTEKSDPRQTLSSPTAIGLLIGNGNVGRYLGENDEIDTFMSTDGGIEWSMIAEGQWLWEFGDRGSIIVIVKQGGQAGEAVKDLKYSLDEGKTWQTYTFTEDAMDVMDLTSVPSDTSRNFLLWGDIDGKLATVNIDFSGLKERSKRCTLDEKNPESDDDDYWLWSPKHPLSETDCLFGHIAKYHRKILDRDCYNGQSLPVLHDISQNCPCTRQDFECDYNFERQPDGSCSLVKGLKPEDPLKSCYINGTKEYSEKTGYRRIPITTCERGRELDFSPMRTRPCPGFEEDYNRAHGLSPVGLFFAIVIPILLAVVAGRWVWQNWDGKFGRIQLGDGPTGSRIGLGGAFDRDAPWIKYPVLGVSAVVAVIAAVPMVVSTVWRTVRTRFGRSGGRYGGYNRPYTSRGSFQRTRGNYSVVDPDEGELLGDESEDEDT